MKNDNLIGLTGGIGSGKSTIARALSQLGYAVYDCDSEAKRIMEENMAVRSQVEYIFGSEVYLGDKYQPQLVAPQVFGNPGLLEKLNRVVHPAVCYDVEHWAKKQNALCFVESAILYESGLAELCTRCVCVSAPLEVRIMRTMARDNAPRDKVEARIAAQQSMQQTEAIADIIVKNDGEKTVAELCADLLWQLGETPACNNQ